MPIIIAAILYLVLAAPALTVVGVVCWARRRPVGQALLGGAVGSAAGFALGCGVAVLVIWTVPNVGANVGATAQIALASLSLALVGMAAGTAVVCMGGPGNG